MNKLRVYKVHDLRPEDVLRVSELIQVLSWHQPPLPTNSISLLAFQKLFGKLLPLLVPLHYILFIPEQLPRNNFI